MPNSLSRIAERTRQALLPAVSLFYRVSRFFSWLFGRIGSLTQFVIGVSVVAFAILFLFYPSFLVENFSTVTTAYVLNDGERAACDSGMSMRTEFDLLFVKIDRNDYNPICMDYQSAMTMIRSGAEISVSPDEAIRYSSIEMMRTGLELVRIISDRMNFTWDMYTDLPEFNREAISVILDTEECRWDVLDHEGAKAIAYICR